DFQPLPAGAGDGDCGAGPGRVARRPPSRRPPRDRPRPRRRPHRPRRRRQHPARGLALGPAMLLGVDVGGTFTDAVLLDDGRVHSAKVPTTPGTEAEGVMRAVGALLERAGAEPDAVEAFAHGMTVGTNALLEERGARTALVATKGFGDVLEIGRQDRPE